MINKTHRFHGLSGLRHVYQRGRTVRGPLFSLRLAPNPKRAQYRAAVVVSKKISKSAVERNRMRRRLYEAVRSLGPENYGGGDIVVTVFSASVLTVEFDRLCSQLKKLLEQTSDRNAHEPPPKE